MNYQNLFNRDFYPTPKSVIDLMMQGAYNLTLDLCWLGYTWRRGIWLKDGEEPRPADNTPGFVASGWFAQFRKDIDPMADIEQMLDGFRDALAKIKEEMEKE